MKSNFYPIRAVSKIIGLSIDTLRAWERRYKAVIPKRSDRGRIYTEEDIDRLMLLKEAVDKGHSISQVAQLSVQRLKELLARPVAIEEKSSNEYLNLEEVFEAIDSFDYGKVDRKLGQLASLLAPRDLIFYVVLPLLHQVGESWHEKDISVSQEHLVSAIIRNLLGGLLRLQTRSNSGAKLLFATPGGELHEFGILSAALLAASGGLGVLYLGPNLPAQEIVDAAKKISAQIVVLGLMCDAESKESLKHLNQISRKLPERIEIWTGGANSDQMIGEIAKTRAIYIPDFNSLEEKFKKLGAIY